VVAGCSHPAAPEEAVTVEATAAVEEGMAKVAEGWAEVVVAGSVVTAEADSAVGWAKKQGRT
jgi:hypothetical protein